VSSEGVLITRAKYVEGQERLLPQPSLRIIVSAAHVSKELEKAAKVLKKAVDKVLAGEQNGH
jgi:serine palmitoyltransferase